MGGAREGFCEVIYRVVLGFYTAEDKAATNDVISNVMIVHLDVLLATSGSRRDYHALDVGQVRKDWCRSHMGKAEPPHEISKEDSLGSTVKRCHVLSFRRGGI